jgi:hypothetical protein
MAPTRSLLTSTLLRRPITSISTSTLLQRPLTQPLRPFTATSISAKDKYPDNLSTDSSVKTDQYPDDEHASTKADKGQDHDVQSSNLKAAKEYVFYPHTLPLPLPSTLPISPLYSSHSLHLSLTLHTQTSELTPLSSAKATGTGGHATEESDSAGGVAKAKKEHPEAPDPAIGMQDERGGRGG